MYCLFSTYGRINRFNPRNFRRPLQIKMAKSSTPRDVCENLVHQVKVSNLNFTLNETPFTVNLCIRKSFTKDFDPLNILNLPKSVPEAEQSAHVNALLEENEKLKNAVEDKDANIKSLKDKVKTLEEAGAKTESDLYKHRKKMEAQSKTIEDNKVLENVMKNLNGEVSRLSSDLKAANKTAKAKEKEIYNLENKNLNQQETIKRLKEDLSKLKAEKSKTDKDIKKLNKKIESDHYHNSNIADKIKSETNADLKDSKFVNKSISPVSPALTASVSFSSTPEKSTKTPHKSSFLSPKTLPSPASPFTTPISPRASTSSSIARLELDQSVKISFECIICWNFFETAGALNDHMEAGHDTFVDQKHNEEKISRQTITKEPELLTVERAKKIMDEVFGNLWKPTCD